MDSTLNTSASWSIGKKLLFRFFFIYFLLYCLFNFVEFTELWTPLITWLGRKMHLFETIPALPNGSGDTTYNYLQVLCYLPIAFVFCMLWSVLDRKRINYIKLQYWFFVMLRYVLGFFMISYGLSKIFKSQFPFPYPTKLLEPIGEQSPMGLAWNFMGYSAAFNLFVGLAEALGGFMLMFRRTTTFGALFSMTVLSNIVAMNFCYDIPVKLFSSHLLLMAIIIALPDAKRLLDFFFLNKTVQEPSFYRPVYAKKWQRFTRITVRFLIVFVLTGYITYESAAGLSEYGDYAPKPPLYGIYNVEEFVLNGTSLPALVTDSTRWRYFVINGSEYAAAKSMTDKIFRYSFKLDTVQKTMQFTANDTEKSTLHYTIPDTNHIVLSGRLLKDSVYMTLKTKNINDYRLVKTKFRWVNEYPYNR